MAQVTDPSDLLPFGLRCRPFQPTADPDFFFPGVESGAALEQIVTALRARHGVSVLVGETGSGKTTLLRKILVELTAGGGLVPICSNAPLGVDELMSLLGAAASASTGEERLTELTRRLRELADEGRPVVLAIDEAQALDEETLVQVIGLLGTGSEPGALASLLLVGQPELSSRLRTLAEAGLEIAVHCSLGPLSVAEVAPYIAHRLEAAGAATAEIFSPAAVERLAYLSGGSPRFLNLLCSESLAFAGREGAGRIDPAIVDRVAEDLGFIRFTPSPELPLGGGAASGRAITPYRLLWVGIGGAAVAVLLLLPWLPRAIRQAPPAPEGQAPAVAARSESETPARAPDALREAVSSGGVEPAEEPPKEEPGPSASSTTERPDTRVHMSSPPSTGMSSPPSTGRQSDTDTIERPDTQPRREKVDARVARPARDALASARSAPRDREQAQALLLRAETGDLAGVRALLAAGESPDVSDRTGFTPLMLAAIHGHQTVGDALLDRGATVDARNRAGQTALMMAAINNHPRFAGRLLDRGARVNARTTAGWTALMYAAWEGHPETARVLLARGADANLRDQAGWTAQRLAAWRVSPQAAAASGGVVTGINNVEASRGAGSDHAAVLALLESRPPKMSRTLSPPAGPDPRPSQSP